MLDTSNFLRISVLKMLIVLLLNEFFPNAFALFSHIIKLSALVCICTCMISLLLCRFKGNEVFGVVPWPELDACMIFNKFHTLENESG